MSISAICFNSCTSSINCSSEVPAKEYYKNNLYAKSYLDNPYLISVCLAKTYISAFKHHNYRGWRKQKLNYPWSVFDTSVLNNIVKDPNIDSVFFYLAAFPRKDKSVPKDSTRHPFIILMAKTKADKIEKEGNSNKLYFVPIKICPPPNVGCAIPKG